MPTYKPIIFSTPMVKAILSGKKTQTRRVVKHQIAEGFDIETDGCTVAAYIDGDGEHYTAKEVAPFRPGDILWVRETWRIYEKAVGKGESFRVKRFFAYKADADNPAVIKSSEWYDNIKPIGGGLVHNYGNGTWRPSIFMPKEAARIFLRVTDVRVEKVQDISTNDACAEGVSTDVTHPGGVRGQFNDLWNSLNADRGFGWTENPWVWVYTFERTQKNAEETDEKQTEALFGGKRTS